VDESKPLTPGLQLFPVPLMRWTGEFYGHVFAADVPGFRLLENDYVVGERKAGSYRDTQC